MKNLLWKGGMPIRNKFVIDSKDTLAEAVEIFKILPFFANAVPGLSIEEMCLPDLLFGGNHDEGCWEWKGPVIRKGIAAYGKFFRKKAGFVSLEILPDFLNYRRQLYPIKEGSTEEMLLEIIKENDSLSSTELKKLIFGSKKRMTENMLPDNDDYLQGISKKPKSLEAPLQKLQMGGWIIINDFEYKKTKRGDRYGWGVARYSTPELTYRNSVDMIKKTSAEESLEKIINMMKSIYPVATSESLHLLLS